MAVFLYILLGLLSTIIILIYLLLKRSYSYWEKHGVPFVKPEYIFGSMKDSLTLKTSLGELILKWYNEYKEKAQDYVGVYFFHEPALLVINPELIKNVMLKDFDHFVDRKTYCNEEDDPLSAHLFSLTGLKWKHLRQKITPTFTSGKLKKMFQTLVDCTEELRNCLDDSVMKSEPVDIKLVLQKYTMDVIGSVAFGIECNSFKNPNSDFITNGSKIFSPKLLDRLKMFLSFVFPNAFKFFKIRVTNKETDRFYRGLVQETVEYREKNNVKKNDFMQLLIQLKNKGSLDDHEGGSDELLTMNEVAAQAFLFFVAGFETSSTTITFCLYELANNPEIQEKSREDIVKTLRKYDGKISYDSIMDMHYLERALRKHPPVMFLQRKVTKEYRVPDTDLILPQDLLVFIPVIGLHNDPDYYPNPDEFNPDNFMEENKACRPDFTFLPFGDGPRNCIGLRFAMLEVKVGLCRLLMHYRFKMNTKTVNPLKLEPGSFIRSVEGGVWLDAEKI